MHEAQLHDRNCFLTLTYGEDAPLSLRYRDFQLFVKRWRQKCRTKVRYYVGGEYGELHGRPHFHAVCFGVDFDDKVYLRKSPTGEALYRSPVLEALWPHGFSSIGSVTFESAAYVARYCMKKKTGDGESRYYNIIDPDTGEIYVREKEFGHMSKGIGQDWLRLYWKDVRNGMVVSRGHEAPAPRYYMKKMRELACMEDVEVARAKWAADHHADLTDERLAVREVVLKARAGLLKRGKV